MKICRIYIKEFEQFQDIDLDFTNPQTGKPVDKICFIGSNGTGKSKILRLIKWFFNSVLPSLKEIRQPNLGNNPNSKIIFKLIYKEHSFLIFFFQNQVQIFKLQGLEEDEQSKLLNNLTSLKDATETRNIEGYKNLIEGTKHVDFLKEIVLNNNSNDLLIYSPDESSRTSYSNIVDVPKTSVSDALALFQNSPFFAQVSPETVDVFWQLLVYNLKKRDDEREKFERKEENLNKTKAQLISEFDNENPKILDSLAKIWDKILTKAGLEFDIKGANNPVQLTDNLKAYIKLKNKSQVIPYSELSTGIRNFIFRIGHIHSLYFNRQIERGFLLIDEPENGLFPDFLFELMNAYDQITIDKNNKNSTQMFFATHNPLIAAQFEPYERIILDWNEDGSVMAKKGVSPIGDDPNDVLSSDFELKDLMGPEGRKMWEKYRNLKKTLIRETDSSKKESLIREINQIGSLYNFS